MSETEQMLLQTLKRMEENYEMRHTSGRAGGAPDASCGGSAQFEKIVQRCRSGVQQLADLVAEIEKRRIAQERERSSPRIRMR